MTISNEVQPVMAISKWRDNGELISACAQLGYLRKDWTTLDPTYGYGTFWKSWRPDILVATDLNPAKSPDSFEGVDFTNMPWEDGLFDCVVFDAPYKLNGTPSDTGGMDERFGVEKVTDWRERMRLIKFGISECTRVLGDGYLLVKCQDQVCSGKVRWQTLEFTNHARSMGLGLVDRLDMLSYRAQPAGRTQVHARRNSSTMLVFKRGWVS